MEQYLDKSFDELLLKDKGLTWLPWIGKNYKLNKKKLLVVGESHYIYSDDSQEYEKKFKEFSKDPLLTRYCIYESALNSEWKNPTYENLHRALLQTNEFDKSLLWENISFYNFIQRLLDYRKRERPTWFDFYNSWSHFINLIKAIKPTDCIFVGVEASNTFNDAMDELNIKYKEVEWAARPISRTYPRIAEIMVDKRKMKIIFMQHSSQMFSWSQWHKFMNTQSPELFEYLKTITKITTAQQNTEPVVVDDELKFCEKIPTNLNHKPIIASNYEKYTNEPNSDAKYLSIGHAQYDYNAASIKMFRYTGAKWSRQSEEIPINRVADFTLLLLAVLNKIQNGDFSQTILGEELVAKEDLSFLEGEIKKNKDRIKTSLFEIKKLINKIDIDNI